jgi:hypothetical protein
VRGRKECGDATGDQTEEVGEGHGRVVVAGGEKSLGGGEFVNTFRGEADEGENGDGGG